MLVGYGTYRLWFLVEMGRGLVCVKTGFNKGRYHGVIHVFTFEISVFYSFNPMLNTLIFIRNFSRAYSGNLKKVSEDF